MATPCLPAALAVALAMAGSCTFSQAVQVGVDVAKGVSDRRYQLMKDLGRAGPSLLTTEAVSSELISAAGKVAGGILTRDDLEKARPEVQAPLARLDGEHKILAVPWGFEDVAGGGQTAVVAASDDYGLLAIACYEVALDGLAIDELGLTAPFTAAPVLRGETRVSPGAHRPAPGPIELREHDDWLEYALGTPSSGQSVGIARSRTAARPFSNHDR